MFVAFGDKRCSLRLLKKFNTITERVAKLKSSHSRNRNSIQDLHAVIDQPLPRLLNVVNLISDVCLALTWIDSVFDPNMHLPITNREPESSAAGELSSSAGAEDDVVSAGASVAVELSSEPQAASPKDIVSASAASPVLATRVRLRLVFMVCLSVGGAVLVRRVARRVLVVRYDRAVGLARGLRTRPGLRRR